MLHGQQGSWLIDDFQLVYFSVLMLAAIITSIIAINSYRKSIKERQRDLLWKQANAAKEFIFEMHQNPYSSAAVDMLDWFSISQPGMGEKDKSFEVTYTDVLTALAKISDKSYSDKNYHILKCFDWFFYFIDRTQQHIIDDLFLFDHVKYIFYPYYMKITEVENKNVFIGFMKTRKYVLALKFWERFETDENVAGIESACHLSEKPDKKMSV